MKMIPLASLLLFTVFLPSGLGRPQVSCKFSIPATNATGSCDVYDLTKTAEAGAMTYAGANNSYVFSLCENVPSSSVPEACKSVGQAVGYQYDKRTKKCYNIGKLDSTYVVSVNGLCTVTSCRGWTALLNAMHSLLVSSRSF